jgi:hypothetical protein
MDVERAHSLGYIYIILINAKKTSWITEELFSGRKPSLKPKLFPHLSGFW